MDDERWAVLERRVAALEARVADGQDLRETDEFWALRGLKERAQDGSQVLFTGSVTLPTGAHYEWQETVEVSSMLEADPTQAVAALSALAHPVRLELLHKVLHGHHTVPELVEGLGTSGQLYHHLRQLVAEGWLTTTGRGQYEVPAVRVVPLVTLLATAGLR
jgi:DNA-binding transcriptional ArsR family regulator